MPSRLILLFSCLLLPLWCAGADAAEAHMAKAAIYRLTVADFVQTRKLSEMDMVLEIRGKMIFERGGKLRWQTDAPMRSVTIIDGGKLEHFDRETGKKAVIEEKDAPWLGVLRECMNDWLGGDVRKLAGRFDISRPEANSLLLVPKDRTLETFYRSILLKFPTDAGTVESIEIVERNGDKLEIRFTDIRHPDSVPDGAWRTGDR